MLRPYEYICKNGMLPFVNSLSCQFGTQDDYVFEDGVFLEVQDNTQVMEVFAETQHRRSIGLFEALANADIEKFTDFDMGLALGIVFQNIADICPAFGDGRRSEEHTSELQSRSCISYAVFCL